MSKKSKSIDLRKEARGRNCSVRYPGICNGNPETVILAHPNEKSVFGVGTGQKPDDRFGAHCCSSCHDAYDRRADCEIDGCMLLIGFYQAIFRTQRLLIEEGVI